MLLINIYFVRFYFERLSGGTLTEIWKWMNEKASLEDVVVRLRPRTVPNGYNYHMWKAGTIVKLSN